MNRKDYSPDRLSVLTYENDLYRKSVSILSVNKYVYRSYGTLSSVGIIDTLYIGVMV